MKRLLLLSLCLTLMPSAADAQRVAQPAQPAPPIRPIRPIFVQPGDDQVDQGPKKKLSELLQDLDSKDPGVRLQAVVQLADHGPEAKAAIPGLIAALQTKDEDLRLNAALALSKIGKAAVAPLAEQLASDDADVRFYSVWALGWIGPEAKGTATQIIRALADKNEGIRRKAAFTLGRMLVDSDSAIGVLIKAFDDESVDVRQAAAEAVSKYGEKAVAPLVATLESGKEPARVEAASALGQIGSDAKAAVPALRKVFLSMEVGGDIQPYAEALSKLGKASLPVFTEALKSEGPQTRAMAVQSLGKMGADGASVLVDALASKHVDVRRQAAQTLAPMRISDKMVVLALAFALKDTDENVRMNAVNALQQLGVGAKLAAPQLSEALSDNNYNLRVQAFYLLQSMGENPRPGLLKALDSKDDKVRINTAALMMMVGFDQNLAQPILVAGLKHEDLTLRMQAAFTLAQRRQQIDEVLPILVEGLRSKSSGVRQQALQGLQQLNQQSKIAVPALADLLQDPDPNLRQQAIWVTQSVRGDPDVMIPALAKLFKDGNQGVRYSAIQVIGAQGPKAIPVILDAIKSDDKDQNFRQQAIGALQNVQGDLKGSLPMIADLLKYDHVGVRQSVVQLMARIGEPAAPHVLEALKDKDFNVRLTAAQVLRNFGPAHAKKALPTLQAMAASDTNPNVRNQVIWSLANLGTEGADVLVKLYKESKDDNTRQMSLNALINSQGRPKALPLIMEGLKDPSANIRLTAVQNLQNLGVQAKEALPLLKDALDDSNQNVRIHAGHAIGNMGPAAHPILEEGLKKAKDSGMRQALLQSMSNGGYRSKTGVPTLIENLKDGTPQVRWMAANVLAQIGPDARAAEEALTALANDANPNVRNVAQNALRRIKGQ